MNLIPEWKQVLKKAWSMRLWAASAVCGIGASVVPFIQDKQTSLGMVVVLSILGTVFSIGGMVARIVLQKEFHLDDD